MPARAAAQVVTIHDLNFLSHPHRTRAEVRRDYPSLVGDHARRADAILVSSAFAAGRVVRRLRVSGGGSTVCPPRRPDWAAPPPAPEEGSALVVSSPAPRKKTGRGLGPD